VANTGLPKIFGVPPIISGIGKATNFKFGKFSQKAMRTKAL